MFVLVECVGIFLKDLGKLTPQWRMKRLWRRQKEYLLNLKSYLDDLKINITWINLEKMNKIEEIEYSRFCKEFDIDSLEKIKWRVD